MDISKVVVERSLEDTRLYVTATKYALFMSYGKVGIDAMALYMHYQFTGLLQDTKSVWALDTYCREGLDWGRDRFEKAKTLLRDLDLIEEHRKRDEKGLLGKKYIVVKMHKSQLEPIHLSDYPQVDTPTSGQTATNALPKKVNALPKKRKSVFVPPTAEEVGNYCKERGCLVDPTAFVNFYTSKGWMVGKNKMEDWKAAVRGWESREKKRTSPAKEPEYLTADQLRERGML